MNARMWLTREVDWEIGRAYDPWKGSFQRAGNIGGTQQDALYTVIMRLSGKHAAPLAQKVIETMKPLATRIETITVDNGLEFSEHARIAKKLDADIYFAHPYASWERGTNENTNGLIRQYFPKGTDFNQVTDEQIEQVMNKLNNRPHKSRGCKSPNELFGGGKLICLPCNFLQLLLESKITNSWLH